MIKTLQKGLGRFADFINDHPYISIALILAISIFAGFGVTKISFQSNLDNMMPDLPLVLLNEKVSEQFSVGDSIIVLIKLDPSQNSDLNDIRDPEIISFTSELKTNILKESLVDEVISPSDLFVYGLPETLDSSKTWISNIPAASSFFGKGYDWTIVYVKADIGNDEAKIRELNDRIEEIILESGKPQGVSTVVTGTPSLVAVMFNYLINDSVYTLIAAAILIFILIIIIEKSLSKSVVVMVPLLLGIEWTIGIMGWLQIPITIATAGLSAMLLGLGVEYSIFLFSRYEEEHVKKSSPEAIKAALSTTGASTISSGLTTVIGFGVLTLSTFPVLSDMGKSLALGISLILFAVVFSSPVIIKLEEKFLSSKKKKKKGHGKLKDLLEYYGRFVSNSPVLVIIVMVILTGSMFVGIGMMKNQNIDFDTVLPSDLAQLQAFKTIQNERGETEEVIVYIQTLLTEDSDVSDARQQDVAEYVDLITQKLGYVAYFDSISSYTEVEKDYGGRIFSSFSDRRTYFNAENSETFNYFTSDYSGTIMRLSLVEDALDDSDEALRQIREIVEDTPAPAGIDISVLGEIAVNQEVNEVMTPDSAKTALYALIGVTILLFILSRSVKYTILPLFTVLVAIIWTLGLVGFVGIPFSSITSSVLSITIGIGIDFGLQLSMRYRQDREKHDKKRAMTETLKHTLYPMIITVVAALIGFQAMSLGNLKLMADLGNTMGFSIVSSMIVAVTLVASLIILFDRKKK